MTLNSVQVNTMTMKYGQIHSIIFIVCRLYFVVVNGGLFRLPYDTSQSTFNSDEWNDHPIPTDTPHHVHWRQTGFMKCLTVIYFVFPITLLNLHSLQVNTMTIKSHPIYSIIFIGCKLDFVVANAGLFRLPYDISQSTFSSGVYNDHPNPPDNN